MNPPVRVALIGCGSIAAKHVTAIGRIPGAEIVAVCDTDGDAGRKLATDLSVPFYSDPHHMTAEVEFDTYDILTPSGNHAKVVLDLAGYGRHFIVEKPLALRIDDADQVIQACDASGAKLFVVKQNRFNRPVEKLKEALDQGRFGKLVMGTVRVRWCRPQSYYDQKSWRGTWQHDGGVLTNQASHHIDMLVWLMGDVESVMAMTATRLAHIEAEDTGAAVIRFTSGAIGIVEATTATRPKDLEGSISILGEGGSVEIGGYFMNDLRTWSFLEPKPWDDDVRRDWAKNPGEVGWNHTRYLEDAFNAIRTGTAGLVDGLEGRKSLELISAIYESAETGRKVSLRFRPQKCRLGEA